MNVTVSKTQLVGILEDNRDEHRKKFEVAFERFRQAATGWFQERLDTLAKGEIPDTYFMLPTPEDHTTDYDRMINMLKMHKDETIVIGGGEYKNYVDDEWPWTQATRTTNTFYNVN